jgi:hypothetical protein
MPMKKSFIIPLLFLLIGGAFFSFQGNLEPTNEPGGWQYTSVLSTKSPALFMEAFAQGAEIMPLMEPMPVMEAGSPVPIPISTQESPQRIAVSTTATAQTIADDENAITIYNGNLALVKQVRELDFDQGMNTIQYTEVPKQIQTNTVFFEDLDDENTRIVEQSYEYDLVSGNKLFEKFIDQEIEVTVVRGDETEVIEGVLLSANWGDIVLETQDGIKTIQKTNVVDTEFPELPGGLLTKPTLVWAVWADKAGNRKTKTSYLTGGLSWSSDYVAVVGENDDELSLKGWTTINNNSGATFSDTKLKLVAGDVNVVTPRMNRNTLKAMPMMAMEESYAMDMDDGRGAGGFGQESFFEYHLYSLDRKTTIKDNSSKQIELFNANDIAAEKEYVFDPQKSHDKVRTIMNFKNEEENNLGMPIPKGVLRVYKNDKSGALQFIGEDNVDHTPKDEEIEIFLGNAFDVTVEKKQTKYDTTKNWVGFRECTFAEQEITLKNHKEEDVIVNVSERVWGANAEIQNPKIDFYATAKEVDEDDEEIENTEKDITVKNEGDGEFVMMVPVSADKKSILTYTVQNCR